MQRAEKNLDLGQSKKEGGFDMKLLPECAMGAIVLSIFAVVLVVGLGHGPDFRNFISFFCGN